MNSSLLNTAARVSRALPDFRGKSNLGWKLMRGSNLKGQWVLTLPDNTRMTLPRTSQMAWTAAFRGTYDPGGQRLLRSYITPHSVVLDIGAALGLWTVPLAKAAAERQSRLWAFEPLPGNHPWLETNIAANQISNVRLEQCALGAAPGLAFIEALEGPSGNAAIQTTGEEVPVCALDDFAFPAPVSAIKIDVEGYELQVMRGATNLVQRDRPVILGEFSPEWLRRRGEDVDGFLAQMGDRDYIVYGVEPRRLRPWLAPRKVRLHERDASTEEEMLLIPHERHQWAVQKDPNR